MSVLKKIFGSGDDQDADVMYQTEGTPGTQGTQSSQGSTAIDNTDRAIQSERDLKPDAGGSGSGLTFSNNDIQSSTAGTTATEPTPESNVPTTATTAGTAAAGAGTAAAATGATVYASDRVSSDDKQADVGSATYTERSYPLSAESSSAPATQPPSDPDYARGGEAAAGSAVFGGTVLGAGAYAASKNDQTQGTRYEPSVPGDQSGEREVTPYPNTSGASEVGVLPAAGAGGAAMSTYGATQGVQGAERERYYGRPPSSPPSSPPATQTTFGRSDTGRDAAIAGGAVAGVAAAGAGVAAYEGSQSSRNTAIASQIDPNSEPRTVGGTWGDNVFMEQPAKGPVDTRQREGASAPEAYKVDPAEVDKTESHFNEAAAAGGVATAGAVAGTTAAVASSSGSDDQKQANVIPSWINEKRGEYSDLGAKAAGGPAVAAAGLGTSAYALGGNRNSTRTEPNEVPNWIEEKKGEQSSLGAAGAGAAVGAAGLGTAAYALGEDKPKTTTTTTTTTTAPDTDTSSGNTKQGFFSKIFHGEDKSEEVPIGDAAPNNEVQRSGEQGIASVPAETAPAGTDNMITLTRSGTDPDAPGLVIREKPGGGLETSEA